MLGRHFATSAPRCGQSLGRRAGGVGIGRRRQVAGQQPMGRREVGGIVVAHRPDDRQPVRLGREQREVLADPDARRPVAIVPNSPRISAGASGLGSHVSSWLGPPHWKIRMHDRPGQSRRLVATVSAPPRAAEAVPAAPDPSSSGHPPAVPRASTSRAGESHRSHDVPPMPRSSLTSPPPSSQTGRAKMFNFRSTTSPTLAESSAVCLPGGGALGKAPPCAAVVVHGRCRP